MTRFILPSTTHKSEDEQAWVDMDDTGLRGVDMLRADKYENGTERAIMMLTSRIKSWNLTDKEGVLREVNEHNVGLLFTADMNYLADRLTKSIETSNLTNDEKKN